MNGGGNGSEREEMGEFCHLFMSFFWRTERNVMDQKEGEMECNEWPLKFDKKKFGRGQNSTFPVILSSLDE
jgi:hypothetical protein